MKNTKNLLIAMVATVGLVACNGGGGSSSGNSWNPSGIGGGNVDNIINNFEHSYLNSYF